MQGSSDVDSRSGHSQLCLEHLVDWGQSLPSYWIRPHIIGPFLLAWTGSSKLTPFIVSIATLWLQLWMPGFRELSAQFTLIPNSHLYFRHHDSR
ncbi:hypothetical protein ASPFODRAFT_395769 [Aspergillus luchuensis CBS 106.47]|uniref:Uncharacterized protein n=1 Tax=Aspergillus luchuensis (strain CBS 106.47) TaxID=1137211 RepID=A0A1M3T2E0_ASPLC|nr:hypothetical protein ASPFODRAFT_395769 [Aspergillus luchuensis CBS 106.47]